MRMIRTLVIALAILGMGTAHAATQSAIYVANGQLAVMVNTTDPAAVNVFGATGSRPKTINVVDLDGNDIAVDVCQNKQAEGDAVCGPGDAVFSYCTTGNPVTIPNDKGFNGSTDTTVYVNVLWAATGIGPECEGVGTAGTIDVTF